jgi:ferritin-like metal-binding protein YciE
MERNQRYQTFIHKMQQLYRAEKKMNSKLNKSKQRMRLAHVQFQQPIVEVLSEYNKMTVNGFNDRIISTFLEEFNKVIEA